MKINGKAWKFSDNINTDEIIPARYLNTSDPAELAKHCMEDADPDFMNKYQKGDIIVGGVNFGCGSSREHAPISIKEAGISVVIASSFARIFFRNCINIGLPIVEADEISKVTQSGDEIEIDLANGIVENKTRSVKQEFPEFPAFMQKIINAGGLMNFMKIS